MSSLQKRLCNLSFVVCDDEQAGCEVITHLLKQNGVSNVAVFNNPKVALQYLAKNSVDVAFLDIKMPQINGLELARQLKGLQTQVVFITAHQEFALGAFEVCAVDYLTKPVASSRFSETLIRIVERNKNRGDATNTNDNYQIIISDKSESIPVWNREIKTIESADKYSVIATFNEQIIWRKPIAEIERLLKADIIRIHRSTMVNIKWIQRLTYKDRKWYIITLDDRRLPVSEKYRAHLSESLSRR